MIKKTLIVASLSTTLTLSGCVGLVLGGATVAGGAAFATLHDRRTPGTVVDDKNLQIVIGNKINKNKYLDANSHTNITVYNGVVLVTGEALNQGVVDTIVAMIKPLPKVKRVDASLAISTPSSLLSRAKDTTITTKVKTAIATITLPKFDTTYVKTTTERGNVYLMGLLTRHEADMVIKKVRRVSGVRGVTPLFEYIQAPYNNQ